MRKVIPKNIADEMTKPYIDDAVEKQIEAADVPPRNKLNISFENAGRIDDNKEYKSNQEAYEKNHGKLYDMTHKNTIPWRNYVVYIVLLSMLTCVFTFSKYMSGTTGSGTAAVAKFEVITKGGLTTDNISVDANSSTPNINLDFEKNDTSKAFYIKVTSNSEVDVNITVSQENSSLEGTFANGVNSGVISAGNSQYLIFEYDLDKPVIPDSVQAKNEFYSPGNLEFKIVAEQID